MRILWIGRFGMASRHEVFEVADRLRARGVRVSLRSVIPELRYGGSNRVVGPLLRDWKADRKYLPKVEAARLPEGLQRRLRDFAVELWEAARVDAAAELVAERAALEARERATEEVLDEALARLDVAEAETGRLRERLACLEISVIAPAGA